MNEIFWIHERYIAYITIVSCWTFILLVVHSCHKSLQIAKNARCDVLFIFVYNRVAGYIFKFKEIFLVMEKHRHIDHN